MKKERGQDVESERQKERAQQIEIKKLVRERARDRVIERDVER